MSTDKGPSDEAGSFSREATWDRSAISGICDSWLALRGRVLPSGAELIDPPGADVWPLVYSAKEGWVRSPLAACRVVDLHRHFKGARCVALLHLLYALFKLVAWSRSPRDI
ncbi:hypothetical protein Pogu_2710 [Pyrobaculum oguniense TE7]|uniref:Uncharacterized protein n=1 Tax=Pyrobaculum oguniense (strain DSM 13380 / JCM 10595 / TE7) TaxID=698757 RepID=H6QDW7_PYROT|nr:hypothetical protein Pogu_2710 [Pyrobaculum oguniense TE7]